MKFFQRAKPSLHTNDVMAFFKSVAHSLRPYFCGVNPIDDKQSEYLELTEANEKLEYSGDNSGDNSIDYSDLIEIEESDVAIESKLTEEGSHALSDYEKLPLAVKKNIFAFLGMKELMTASGVNKEHRQFLTDSTFASLYVNANFGTFSLPLENKKDYSLHIFKTLRQFYSAWMSFETLKKFDANEEKLSNAKAKLSLVEAPLLKIYDAGNKWAAIFLAIINFYGEKVDLDKRKKYTLEILSDWESGNKESFNTNNIDLLSAMISRFNAEYCARLHGDNKPDSQEIDFYQQQSLLSKLKC